MWSWKEETATVQSCWALLGEGHWIVRSGERQIDSRQAQWSGNVGKDAANGLELETIIAGDAIQLIVTNSSTDDFPVDEIRLVFDASTLLVEDYLEYVHSKWLYEAQSTVKRIGQKTDFVEANPESSMVYLLKSHKQGSSYLFAVLPPQEEDYMYFQALLLEPIGAGQFGLEIRSEQGKVLPAGCSTRCSKIIIAEDSDPFAMLESLGDRYAALRNRPLQPKAVGWNSWDEIKLTVTADAMRENQVIAKNELGQKVQYFVIDDGWQNSWGDWRFSPDFLMTADEFCREVKQAGGIPGIWLAPLYADKPMMDSHPDWFARMPDGSLIESENSRFTLGCLDITVPEVREHLFNIYRGLKEAGFNYFKVDFTQMVQRCTGFHDKTVGRGSIIRKTFEIIREAVGDDSYILACAPPYESVFGIVDAARITADIQLKWSVVQFNIGSAACRWWMDRKLWNNDPDFVIVRASDYCTNPDDAPPKKPFVRGDYNSGPKFNAREARSWALAAVMMGEVVLGDDLRKLNSDGLALLRRVLELAPLRRTAVPTDLFTCGHNSLPAVWFADEDDRKILAVFNWEEEPIERKISLRDYGIDPDDAICSWFDESILSPSPEGVLELTIQPHDSICLVATRSAE
ncbi:MAG: alpha-galactosidase [Phycisphaerae bacterium]|nr:alpha-galactosidase [Phycisphaerae bacterium]